MDISQDDKWVANKHTKNSSISYSGKHGLTTMRQHPLDWLKFKKTNKQKAWEKSNFSKDVANQNY